MTVYPQLPVPMMPPGPGCVDLWCLCSSEGMRRPARARYLQWFDTREQARYRAHTDQRGREQFLTGHGWLREVLARYLADEPARIILEQGLHGKPELLTTEPPALHFNLSHTQGLLVLAISSSPVGVDVEAHQSRDVQALCQRFFSAQERRALSRTARTRRLAYFYRLWTLKEAWVKATGVGICGQWRQLRIARGRSLHEGAGQASWRLSAAHFPGGYSLAVASLSPSALSVRTFVDTALAGYSLCRDNLRWLEHHPADETSHMRYIHQGVTL